MIVTCRSSAQRLVASSIRPDREVAPGLRVGQPEQLDHQIVLVRGDVLQRQAGPIAGQVRPLRQPWVVQPRGGATALVLIERPQKRRGAPRRLVQLVRCHAEPPDLVRVLPHAARQPRSGRRAGELVRSSTDGGSPRA